MLARRHALGNYYIFYDDDVVLHTNAINNIVKNFKDMTIGAVGGRVLRLAKLLNQRERMWAGFALGSFLTIFFYHSQDTETLIGAIGLSG